MTQISKPFNFSNGTTADANQVDQNFDALFNLLNGNLDDSNTKQGSLSQAIATEAVTPAKSKGLAYAVDVFGGSFIYTGGVPTKDGTNANTIDVPSYVAYITQPDGTLRRLTTNATTFVTNVANGTFYLDLNPDGTFSWGGSHSTQAGYVTICTVVADSSSNVSTITDTRPTQVNILSGGVGQKVLGNVYPIYGLPNRLRPSIANFVRNSVAWRKNFSQVVANQIRTEMGAMGDAPYIEESTTNLGVNTGFETVTGTATVFSDALTSYTGSTVPAPWTLQSGGFSFGASGATSTANGSIMTAGNANWKPITGSNGSALTITEQATFTTPSTLSTGVNANIILFQSSGNYYEAFLTNTSFVLAKQAGGYTQLATVAQTISASTAYTITLSLSTNGTLTAKLYSGVGTGGTLLQTLTATDTSLTGGFQIGVGGDTGVVIKSAQVTAPFADGWTIGGDSRVAWALTSQAIAGNYSVNAVGVASGVQGQIQQTISGLTAGNSYSISGFANSSNAGSSGSWVELDFESNTPAYLSSLICSKLTGTLTTQRYTASGTAPTNTASGYVYMIIKDSGTATFDCIQLEQKAYATSYIENSATSGSVTRNADSLSYTLHAPLPNRWFGAVRWIPDQGSNTPNPQTSKALLWTTNKAGTVWRHNIAYSYGQGGFIIAKNGGATAKVVVPFNAGDIITIFAIDDPVSGNITIYVGVNGGTLQSATASDSNQFTDAQVIYVGSRDTSNGTGVGGTGFEANGTVEPLLTDKIPTTEQLNWLYNAPLWGQGNFPDVFQPNTGWYNPTLLNGWVNYGGTLNANAQYRKDANGVVTIRGLVKSGTITSGTAFFTLPVGFRPSVEVNAPSVSNNGSTTVLAETSVMPNGTVQLSNGGANTWYSLDNISFLAEQ